MHNPSHIGAHKETVSRMKQMRREIVGDRVSLLHRDLYVIVRNRGSQIPFMLYFKIRPP